MNQKYCLVYTTCPSKQHFAEIIAKALIQKKLVACVNILNHISSMYLWEGKLCCSKEKLLIIKTTNKLFERVKAEILKLHPYECPEVISINISKVSQQYLVWLQNVLNIK